MDTRRYWRDEVSFAAALVAVAILALVAVGCAGSGGQGATGPSGIGSSDARAGLLGAPPNPSIGTGAGTGTLPTTPNSCPSAGPTINANQNNTKLEGWLPGEMPAAGVRHVEWKLLNHARQEVAKGISEPADPSRGRGFVFYPKNGGIYFIQAQIVYTGCRGGVGQVQTSFNKAPDNPDPPTPPVVPAE